MKRVKKFLSVLKAELLSSSTWLVTILSSNKESITVRPCGQDVCFPVGFAKKKNVWTTMLVWPRAGSPGGQEQSTQAVPRGCRQWLHFKMASLMSTFTL